MALVRQVHFASAYSFNYSPRPGTPAAADDRQVEEHVKNERLYRLQALLREQQTAFNAASVGQTMPVLLLRDGKHDGQLLGKSPWMQSVHVSGAEAYRGQIVDMAITGGYLTSLAGEIAGDWRKTA
jgi:tRNA-2-methylthio-N6-dimethylallyladenosine synthase